jgi:site-specific recombinase XerD
MKQQPRCSESRLALNRTVVLRYRTYLEARQLARGTINLRLGAVRRLACEAAEFGLLSSDLAAGISGVKGLRNLGVRLGNWLSSEHSLALLQAPDHNGLKGKRDRALLALLPAGSGITLYSSTLGVGHSCDQLRSSIFVKGVSHSLSLPAP